MPSREFPNLGLKGDWDLGEDLYKDENDLNLLKLSVLTQGRFLDLVPSLPGSPTNGDVYVLDETAVSHANDIAIRDEGAWVYVTPEIGWSMFNATLVEQQIYDGAQWVTSTGGFADAPSDGLSYIRKDGDWVALASTPTTGGGSTTPGATVPTYATSDQWRVVSLSPGPSGGATGGEFGEIDFFDEALAGISFTGATVTASSEAAGFEASKASDASYASGNGWRYDVGTETATGATWTVQFAAPVTPRSIAFHPIIGSNQSSTAWALEYYNGTIWVRLQTFSKLAWGGASVYEVAPVPASAPVTGGEVAALELDDLADVNAPTPADGDALVWDAATSKWIPGAGGGGPTTDLFEFQGVIDCSGNPNYPAALVGDAYIASVAGKIGGGAGIDVEVHDLILCIADNAGGTQAGVGAGWVVLQGNTTITAYTDEMARDAIGTALAAGPGVTITVNDGADTITIAGKQEWAWTLNANATIYIPCDEAMTIDAGNAAIGTGSLAYEKSTTAAPSTFAGTSLPATLQAGAWLKIIATGVSGFLAVHLKRTA